ncbi:MAG: nucleotide exchange factor GrpE [Arcobacter butzleri]|nr:nucleotide exchange factor GrpE [Aliarcobacter butzleri]
MSNEHEQDMIKTEEESKIVEQEELQESDLDLSNINEVSLLQAKLKDAEDRYLRVHADFENIKKRMEKEKFTAIEYASEKFARDLLASIDTLEFAIASLNNQDANPTELIDKVKEGIELTIKSFVSAFEKNGIEFVDTDNGFDPNFHDAVMQVESDNHEEGEIVQVLQKGYKYKDRLLRPAMVSICKK